MIYGGWFFIVCIQLFIAWLLFDPHWTVALAISLLNLFIGATFAFPILASLEEEGLKPWVQDHWRAGRATRCLACGYPLDELQVPNCPECGHRVDGPPDAEKRGWFGR